MSALLPYGRVDDTLEPLSRCPVLYLDRQQSSFSVEGSRVTQWNDASGNGHHATAGSGTAQRPTLAATGVSFDGLNHLEIAAAFEVGQPYTVVVAFTPANIVGNKTLIDTADGAGGTARAQLYAADETLRVNLGTDVSTLANLLAGQATIATVLADGANTVVYQRNTQVFSGNAGALKFMGANVGANVVEGVQWNGLIHSIAVFPRLLNDVEREAICRSLAIRYIWT